MVVAEIDGQRILIIGPVPHRRSAFVATKMCDLARMAPLAPKADQHRGVKLMPSLRQLVVFVLDDQRYALTLDAVEQIVHMVKVTPLPKAPSVVSGIVNVGGDITPVFDIRRRFHLPEKERTFSNQLIIARTSTRTVALVADTVNGMVECQPHDVVPGAMILSDMAYVTGVVKLNDGLLFIHDLDGFLSLEEARTLGDAVEILQQSSHDPYHCK